MLLDHRSIPGLAFASCFVRDELTAEAAEVDAARDMEVYLGFDRDAGLHICRPQVAYVRADFVGSPPERQSRFKGQPVRSAVTGGAEKRSECKDHGDRDDDVHADSLRLKVLHQTGLKSASAQITKIT